MNLRQTGVINSLGLLRVIAYVESEFDLEVEPLEGTDENFGSVAGIVAFVNAKLPARQEL